MKVKMRRELLETFGEDLLKKIGINYLNNWTKSWHLDTDNLSIDTMKELEQAIEPFAPKGPKRVKGALKALKVIKLWTASMDQVDYTEEKCKNVKQFFTLAMGFLGKTPGHRVYIPDDQYVECNLAYYVKGIYYHPPRTERSGKQVWHYPAFVDIRVCNTRYDTSGGSTFSFHITEIHGKTVHQVLLASNIFPETIELRKAYLEERTRFEKEIKNIGKQFWATGLATDDVDGNDEVEDKWYRRKTVINLEKDDIPSKVVVDVFYEEKAKEEIMSYPDIDQEFWKSFEPKDDIQDLEEEKEDEDEDTPEAPDDDEETEEQKVEISRQEIPVHPFLVVFDLKKHRRMEVHINQLEDYKYDTKLGEKLILPKENHSLVETLMASDNGYNDIISGKGAGAVILCAGPPGTGKTLTAEVFSEVAKRPLYTVQCSQLGLNSDDLEESLLKIFARAQRWKAILLLDEADVYIRRRGDEIEQNAIVGVFLRTLEYYNGVMFMTTNRPDTVDDAIASRCVARITYDIPSEEDQAKIWKVLAQTAGVKIGEKDLNDILGKHMKLSGRDIKNLLKLAIMVAKTKKEPITLETINFVKRFKPTID